jgi:hypothetical protein
MAAQHNPWGTVEDQRPASRTSPRRGERQNYRQPTPSKKAHSSVFPHLQMLDDALTELRFNPFAAFLDAFRDEAPAIAGTEADLLPTILASIDRLISPDANDGDLPATEYAYQSARAVVESAYGRLRDSGKHRATNLPAPIVTTDDIGGVKLSWQRGDRHVRTSFAASQGMRSYLYFESAAEHAVEDLQPSALSSRLEWILRP